MNQRKAAFKQGLRAIKKHTLSSKAPAIAQAQKMRYNGQSMLTMNQIVQGDSVALLNSQPEGFADLVFADPPFNIGYLYHGYDDEKDVHEYCDWSETWMRAVHRALKPSGSFFLAIGDEFAADLTVIARRKIGFTLRNWIVWHYTFGQQTRKKFAKSHTHILYFTKDKDNFTFNADAIRVASARQTTYADVRANPKGKVPDDTWFLRPQEAAPQGYFEPGHDVWNESRVCGTFKEREGWHGCQMPIGVLNRIILAASNPGDVVVDPFNGSGTTVVAAALNDRKYLGIDQSAEYVGYAQKRLAHALEHRNVAAVTDVQRASRVQTATDAFGRKRVARGSTVKIAGSTRSAADRARATAARAQRAAAS